MVVRSAVGALGAVALLGALGMALPERGTTKPPATKLDPPFGSLTKADFKATAVEGTPAPVETAQILKLAAVAPTEVQPKPEPDRAPEATLIKAAATTDAPLRAAEPISKTEPNPASAPEVIRPTSPQVASPATAPDTPIKTAMAEEAPPTSAASQKLSMAPRVQKTKTGLNINTASVDDLDHIPGAGRIGRTIVRHRPYRKIEDLVEKRVLRMSAFQRIQSSIKVD